ncbi:MAG: hypothetical protein AAGC74_06730 [Verrucomicrobiota bacterium]
MKENERRKIRAENCEKNDRYLRSLDQERCELWQQLREAPWRKLKEPFQRGWERSFVLRADAQRRKDADQLAAALKFVENYQQCRVCPFRRYDWRKRRFVEWGHHLSGLSPRDVLFNKVPEELLKYFQVSRHRVASREQLRILIRSGWMGKFWFRYPEYGVSETRPFMVTHERVALPQVESRLEEIDSILCEPKNQGRLWHLHGYSHRRWNCFMNEEEDRRRALLDMREAEEAVQEFYRSKGDSQPDDRVLVIRLGVFLFASFRNKHPGILRAFRNEKNDERSIGKECGAGLEPELASC